MTDFLFDVSAWLSAQDNLAVGAFALLVVTLSCLFTMALAFHALPPIMRGLAKWKMFSVAAKIEKRQALLHFYDKTLGFTSTESSTTMRHIEKLRTEYRIARGRYEAWGGKPLAGMDSLVQLARIGVK